MAEVQWVIRANPDGTASLAVGPTGNKYRDVDQTHIEALERVIDETASSRINELEQLYGAVQDTESERLAAAKYKDSVNEQWKSSFQKRRMILLEMLDDTEQQVPGGQALARLCMDNLDARSNQTLSFLRSSDGGNDTMQYGENETTAINPKNSARFKIVASQASVGQLVFNNGSSLDQNIKLNVPDITSIIGETDEFANRARFSRELMSKSTVPLRVHTTVSGQQKRSRIDDDTPYGGRSKQWEKDAHNVSLDDHIRELQNTIRAIGSGMLVSDHHKNTSFVVVGAPDYSETTEITFHSGGIKGKWKGTSKESKKSFVLEYTDDEQWSLRVVQNLEDATIQTEVLPCSVNELTWSPQTAASLSGVAFGSYYVYTVPPTFMWAPDSLGKYKRETVTQWTHKLGNHITVRYLPQIHCDDPICYAALIMFTTEQETILNRERVIMGVSQSCHAYIDLMSRTSRLPAQTSNMLFSAYPFQEQDGPDDTFKHKVLEGFHAELERLHDQPFQPTRLLANHPLSNCCYTLTQAPALSDDYKPVIQMSNGENKWAIGSTATVASDAIVATLIYVRSILTSNERYS